MWWAHSRDEAGGTGQKGEGDGKKSRENPKGPEGWEGGRAQAGNRDYLQRRPWAAVRLALAVLAAEPAAPPGALGHPGTALASASSSSRSPRPRRRVGCSAAARGGTRPIRGGLGQGRAQVGVRPPGEAGWWQRAISGGVRRGGGAPAGAGPGAGRSRGEAPRAPGGRRIAKRCGLAKIAEPRRERAQEGGI